MRYVVVGAGAVGSAVGGLLAHRGRSVVLVARGAHARAMRAGGLTVRCPDTAFTVAVPVVTEPAQLRLRVDDVLVLTTKTHQAQAAVEQWADTTVHDLDGVPVGTAAESLPILTASNGVTAEDITLRYFDRVFAVCVLFPTVMVDPGTVIVRGTPLRGIFHLSRYGASADSAADHALLDWLGEDWDDAGCLTRLPPDVMSWKYRKLLANLGNIVEALVDDAAAAEPILTACRAEAEDVLDAAGMAVVPAGQAHAGWDHEALAVCPVIGGPENHGSSTWQSLARSTGSVETDFLNGEIARIGREVGVPAPVNAALAAVARRVAQERRRPKSMTAIELRAHLNLGDRLGGQVVCATSHATQATPQRPHAAIPLDLKGQT